MVKTYYISRDYHNQLPIEFVCSTNDKYISFQYCRCTCNNYVDAETEVHASFIQRDEYCDSLVWYANMLPVDNNRKYKYIGTKRDFDIWFTDATGRKLSKDEVDNFCIFLKLDY